MRNRYKQRQQFSILHASTADMDFSIRFFLLRSQMPKLQPVFQLRD